ncbi:homologous-pairing protein 2 homolog [Gigantopelta aegis]|uniref:homologous-pairing protein 2 homolog n=1 Tax=Gigantopelta aegis TaxID=1735272 RepID=UPI001B88A23D|nr:homologous-pairing protein 2 homolog [Gigantopelta aegis]
MSKSKEAGAAKGILIYLAQQNRPYSVVDIFNNYGKEFGKTAVQKACESLAEEGKIREKVYGKQKVYVADQSQFPDVNDEKLKAMDLTISKLTDDLQNEQTEMKKLESELKVLNSSITTKEAQNQIEELTREIETMTDKLNTLKEGRVLISPQEKEKVYKNRVKYVKEWRKRKRISTDIVSAVLEGYPKTKKQLLEEIGIETDEDYNVKPPEV